MTAEPPFTSDEIGGSTVKCQWKVDVAMEKFNLVFVHKDGFCQNQFC